MENEIWVTPCVGVWIETLTLAELVKSKDSHPAWVCGLKHGNAGGGTGWEWSHPAWVCGLKQITRSVGQLVKFVTPCVGVWIETI